MMEKNEGEWRFEMAGRAHKTKENGVKVDSRNGKWERQWKEKWSATIYLITIILRGRR